MHSLATFVATTGAFLAATVLARDIAAASGASSATSATTNLVGAEAIIPTGVSDGEVAASDASGSASASAILGGATGAFTYDPLLPPVATGITHTIDGTLYVPATMCVDYQNYTESSTWSPSNPTEDPSITIDPYPTVNPTGNPSITFDPDPTVNPTLDPYPSGGSSGGPSGSASGSASGKPGMPTGGGTTMQTTTTTSGDVSIPTGEIPPSYSAVANIQLDASNDESRQFDIPTDNTLTPILRRGFRAEEMTVVSADDETVTCQAFNDKAGRVKLGKPVKVGEKGDVTKEGEEVRVRAVKCGAVLSAPPI